MTATLSGDHRVTDGLAGARFLSALRERLAHPEAS
jgi:pyruvate dehydrogenase E2 component (dihydrolipoamide acetyltransferase)